MSINYKSFFGEQSFHNEFTKCIICFNPDDKGNPSRKLTDEHIVPEFIGGKIVVNNVCKECNSRLGHTLEGPLSNNIYFRLYAYLHKIKGKKNKITNPLYGEYTYNDVRFRFESDFSLYQLPVINHQPTADGGFKISATIDVKDLKSIENDLFKTISRNLKKSGKILKEDKIRQDIQNIINASKENVHIINQPEINISFSLDFDQIAILALKIIYELVAWLGGEDFIASSEFDLIRTSLKRIQLHPEIKYVTHDFYKTFRKLLEQNPYYKVENFTYIDHIFSKNKTIVVFVGGSCSVRLLNLWFSFEIPEALNKAFLIFTSESKTGIFNIYREDIFSLDK